MSTSVLHPPVQVADREAAAARSTAGGLVADYLELTKPRIAVLVLVTVAVAAFVAQLGPARSAVALAHAARHGARRGQRQRLESMARTAHRCLMARTADRPLARRSTVGPAKCCGSAG